MIEKHTPLSDAETRQLGEYMRLNPALYSTVEHRTYARLIRSEARLEAAESDAEDDAHSYNGLLADYRAEIAKADALAAAIARVRELHDRDDGAELGFCIECSDPDAGRLPTRYPCATTLTILYGRTDLGAVEAALLAALPLLGEQTIQYGVQYSSAVDGTPTVAPSALGQRPTAIDELPAAMKAREVQRPVWRGEWTEVTE